MEEKINLVEESDKLIQLFKEFETLIKQKGKEYGIITDGLTTEILIKKLSEKSSYFKRKQEEMDMIRKIRNLNTHYKGEKYKYILSPSPEINEKLEKIIQEIKNPPMIYNSSICIKRKDIYYKTLEDTIYDAIKTMSEKMYTHIPILEKEKLVGVFSENTLLDVVKEDSGIILEEDTKFSTIQKYLKIENHSMEDFLFVSKRKNRYDIEEMFKDYFSRNKRIGCIYVTENGKDTESILGMLTAWDVLGKR